MTEANLHCITSRSGRENGCVNSNMTLQYSGKCYFLFCSWCTKMLFPKITINTSGVRSSYTYPGPSNVSCSIQKLCYWPVNMLAGKFWELHVLTSGVAKINLVRSFGELSLLFKIIKEIYLILVNNGAIDGVRRVMNDSFRSVSTLKMSLKIDKTYPH